MTIKLIVNDKEIILGTDSIRYIPSLLSDQVDMQDVFHEFALSSICSIKEAIARKESISKKTAKLLLSDKDGDVLNAIITNPIAQCIATDKDLEHIIRHAPETAIEYLAQDIRNFKSIDIDKTYKKLMSLNNPVVLFALADKETTPNNILVILMKHDDNDISLSAKNSFSKNSISCNYIL